MCFTRNGVTLLMIVVSGYGGRNPGSQNQIQNIHSLHRSSAFDVGNITEYRSFIDSLNIGPHHDPIVNPNNEAKSNQDAAKCDPSHHNLRPQASVVSDGVTTKKNETRNSTEDEEGRLGVMRRTGARDSCRCKDGQVKMLSFIEKLGG